MILDDFKVKSPGGTGILFKVKIPGESLYLEKPGGGERPGGG